MDVDIDADDGLCCDCYCHVGLQKAILLNDNSIIHGSLLCAPPVAS